MPHPNQFFIDNFNKSSSSSETSFAYLYGSQNIEIQRKKKFECFLESVMNPQKNKNNDMIKSFSKIFNYNTLSKTNVKKPIDVKQSLLEMIKALRS